MVLTKDQRREEWDKKQVGVRKSRCIELDRTYYYIGKFNIAFSLYRVLGITLYFSKNFSKVAAEVL